MDRQALAVLIPVLAVFFGGLIAVSRTAIGQAIARRIGGEPPAALRDERLDTLEAELDQARRELDEVHERLDFAERMLGSTGTTASEFTTPVG